MCAPPCLEPPTADAVTRRTTLMPLHRPEPIIYDVVARILNATLIIPKLDQKSFWKDASDFADIFYVELFISSLSNDVKIIRQIQFLRRVKWLVQRMRAKSGRFIALHLRFEPDMLAFSGCYFGGGEIKRTELDAIRKRWKTLHASNSDRECRHGKCPLTPEEVGLMLRALGFGDDVHLYVASGDVYGGEETLAPLKTLFPNFHSKVTLASKEELTPFFSFSSRCP
ncbi:hypothetical protein GUJ93_ZPchr0013g37686 [Zizania palustris]|uniref:O-fucosyltransferase family protein n=1 Tax=Zizania palustris TaxID=103762 RepID=A0A8J6BX37_ZIZPA|nr:hypothetical protein GUJ93_ZPchr0013g37686 [Zizania palustris]